MSSRKTGMTWPATPTTSNRHAQIEILRPCMEMVTTCCALGRVVSGDQGTSDSVCWPTASRCWRKYPRRCTSETATIGAAMSAAERRVSPASIPRPPE